MKPAIHYVTLEKQEHAPEHGTGSPIVDGFSLIQGGPIYSFQRFLGMAMPDRSGVVHRALLAVVWAWVPLLILSFLQGLAVGDRVKVPFLYDIAANVRFLITLPLLIIAEVVIDPRLRHSAGHFVTSGLVPPAELRAYEGTVMKMMRLRDSPLPSILLLAAAFLPSLSSPSGQVIHAKVSTWHSIQTPSGEIVSLAGWWFALISIPLYRLLMLRWVWVLIMWAIFLRSVSKLRLYCVPTHPDKAAGFGFLTHTQLFFGLVTFAGSAVTAAALANSIAYEGETIAGLKFLLIATCVLIVALVAAPLLVLTPKLMRVKEAGLLEYGALGTAYTQRFDMKWLKSNPSHEDMLGSADIQSLADLSTSFSIVHDMQTVLIDKEVLLGLVVPSVLPVIVLLFFETPADELSRMVLKLLG